MRATTCGLFLLIAGLGLLSGCGGEADNLPATVDAAGVITLDGDPVHGASIVLAPAEGGQYPAFGMSDEDGYFELKAFEAKGGAVPGSYQVQASKTVERDSGSPSAAQVAASEDAQHAAESPDAGVSWENVLPKQYANVATSGLTVVIPEDGTQDLKIELVSQ